MTLYVFFAVNPVVLSKARVVYYIHGENFLKDGYSMLILNGHHRLRSVQKLSDEDGTK